MVGAISYVDFFAAFLDAYNARFPEKPIGVKPSHKSWMKIGKPDFPPGAGYHLSFTHDRRFRVEITFQSDNRDLNKFMFNQLVRHRDEIEEAVGGQMEWERKDGIKRAQISMYYPKSSEHTGTVSAMERYLDWVVPASKRFQDVINEYLVRYGYISPPS